MSRVDSASRLVSAAPARVYDALTEAQGLEGWLPPAGMRGSIERFDASVGGGFRMTLTYLNPPAGGGKSSEAEDVTDVEFAELAPGERVVWRVRFLSEDPAYAGTMTMTWQLDPTSEGSLVTVAAADVPPGIPGDAHEAGLASSLANLAAYVESV